MKYEITLGNKKSGDTGEYIGRGTPLGNPFRIGRDGNRKEVIDKYAHWLKYQFNSGTKEVLSEIFRLEKLCIAQQGLTLVCHCTPEKCHGEIIREVLYAIMAKKIEFNALMVGGPHDGQIGRLTCEKFEIGMQFDVEGLTYEVEDGPAAQAIEQTQQGHESLAVRCKLIGESGDAKVG
jgi:hypothetical protein